MPKKKNKTTNISSSPAIHSVEEIIEVVENLEDTQKEEILGMMVKSEMFTGPLPPPHLLQGYNDIDPGFADRIICMAEKEQQAQIDERTNIVSFAGRDALLGAVFTFIIIVITILLGGFLIMNDKSIAGYSSLAIGLGGLIKLFLPNGKDKIKDEIENKEDINS